MVYVNGCLIFITCFLLIYSYTVLHNMVQGLYHKIDELEENIEKMYYESEESEE